MFPFSSNKLWKWLLLNVLHFSLYKQGNLLFLSLAANKLKTWQRILTKIQAITKYFFKYNLLQKCLHIKLEKEKRKKKSEER